VREPMPGGRAETQSRSSQASAGQVATAVPLPDRAGADAMRLP
jgi:hypothetical protein